MSVALAPDFTLYHNRFCNFHFVISDRSEPQPQPQPHLNEYVTSISILYMSRVGVQGRGYKSHKQQSCKTNGLSKLVHQGTFFSGYPMAHGSLLPITFSLDKGHTTLCNFRNTLFHPVSFYYASTSLLHLCYPPPKLFPLGYRFQQHGIHFLGGEVMHVLFRLSFRFDLCWLHGVTGADGAGAASSAAVAHAHQCFQCHEANHNHCYLQRSYL